MKSFLNYFASKMILPNILQNVAIKLFKTCVCIYQIFIFSPNDSTSKTMKSDFYFI